MQIPSAAFQDPRRPVVLPTPLSHVCSPLSLGGSCYRKSKLCQGGGSWGRASLNLGCRAHCGAPQTVSNLPDAWLLRSSKPFSLALMGFLLFVIWAPPLHLLTDTQKIYSFLPMPKRRFCISPSNYTFWPFLFIKAENILQSLTAMPLSLYLHMEIISHVTHIYVSLPNNAWDLKRSTSTEF